MVVLSTIWRHTLNLLRSTRQSLLMGRDWMGTHQKQAAIGAIIGIITMISLIGVYGLLHPSRLASPDAEGFKNIQEYQQFINDNPLMTRTPPTDAPFHISSTIRADKSPLYTIELTAPAIKPVMSKEFAQSYLEALTYSQDKALAWIRSQGVDPKQLNIVWRPSPEEMRGKLLGESTHTAPDKNQNADIPKSNSPTSTPTPASTPTGRFNLN